MTTAFRLGIFFVTLRAADVKYATMSFYAVPVVFSNDYDDDRVLSFECPGRHSEYNYLTDFLRLAGFYNSFICKFD